MSHSNNPLIFHFQAIVGYYDIFFDRFCGNKVMFSTSPQVTKRL
ncbi:unnamed protein product [Oncorhynchus mykiss]|uniref:Uncharacterized protein n=1 Tax=Oncorhynchus mykiss TaxID=8022 RepID=A0A060XE44_ONCMY|nr:unnamed protein product [Oncorhynchus mykiss]